MGAQSLIVEVADRGAAGQLDVELATLSWVHCRNTTRLRSAIGHVPPNEFETRPESTKPREASIKPGAVQALTTSFGARVL